MRHFSLNLEQENIPRHHLGVGPREEHAQGEDSERNARSNGCQAVGHLHNQFVITTWKIERKKEQN